MTTRTDPPRHRWKAVKVSGTYQNIVTLECGHVREMNPIYHFEVGEMHNCYPCEYGHASAHLSQACGVTMLHGSCPRETTLGTHACECGCHKEVAS